MYCDSIDNDYMYYYYYSLPDIYFRNKVKLHNNQQNTEKLYRALPYLNPAINTYYTFIMQYFGKY